MKKVIIILLLTLSFQIFSQDENLSKYIGGAFGLSTGYGLSYRYWPGKYGGQVVFSPYSDGEDYTFNLGIGGFRTLYETKYTRLFLYAASNGTLQYLSEEEWTDYTYDEETNEIIDEKKVTDKAETNIGGTLGIGPGMEIYIFKNVALNFMFGYSISLGSAGLSNTGLGFTFETGLYYRF